jgi:hypothetical protein
MADSKVFDLTDGGVPPLATILYGDASGSGTTGNDRKYSQKNIKIGTNSGRQALTDAATIATDAGLGHNVFSVTLGGNRTLGNPTNMVDGATYIWIITQDGTGSRILAFGSAFKWPAATAPVLSTPANSIDVISAVYNGTVLLANCQKGFG